MKGTPTFDFEEIINDISIYLSDKFNKAFYSIKSRNGKKKTEIIELSDLENESKTDVPLSIGYGIKSAKVWFWDDLDKKPFHTLMSGASRGGKSVLIESKILHLISSGAGLMYIEPKSDRESFERILEIARHFNKEVLACSPAVKEVEGVRKIRINILSDGDVASKVDRIISNIIWTNAFYRGQCESALMVIIKGLEKQNRKYDIFLLRDLVVEMNQDKELCESIGVAKGNLNGLINGINNIISDDVLGELFRYVEGETYSFKDLWEQEKIVYVGLSSLKYPMSVIGIIKMILSDVMYAVGDVFEKSSKADLSERKRYELIVDEYGSVLIPRFSDLLNKSLGANLSVTLGFQTPSDVKQLGDDVLERHLVNIRNWFIFNASTEQSSSSFSESIGTIKTVKQTYQTDNNSMTEKGSMRDAWENIAHPQVLKSLNQGQCVYRGVFPYTVELFNVTFIEDSLKNLDFYFPNMSQNRSVMLQQEEGENEESLPDFSR